MINQDRIVPVQATDLLSLYGAVLYLDKSGALDKISAVDVEGDFAVSAASQAMIADQPVKSLDIASTVASAEISTKMSFTDGQISLELADGNKLNADMVVLSVGVTPENTLAKKAGLELGVKGAIKVNAKMETSAPDIYAVGDAVQVKHFVTEQDLVISLAGPAKEITASCSVTKCLTCTASPTA